MWEMLGKHINNHGYDLGVLVRSLVGSSISPSPKPTGSRSQKQPRDSTPTSTRSWSWARRPTPPPARCLRHLPNRLALPQDQQQRTRPHQRQPLGPPHLRHERQNPNLLALHARQHHLHNRPRGTNPYHSRPLGREALWTARPHLEDYSQSGSHTATCRRTCPSASCLVHPGTELPRTTS